jgi:hypothetical protein
MKLKKYIMQKPSLIILFLKEQKYIQDMLEKFVVKTDCYFLFHVIE